MRITLAKLSINAKRLKAKDFSEKELTPNQAKSFKVSQRNNLKWHQLKGRKSRSVRFKGQNLISYQKLYRYY